MSATVDYNDTAKRGKVKIECIALAGRYVRNSYLNAKVNLTLDSSAPVLLGLFLHRKRLQTIEFWTFTSGLCQSGIHTFGFDDHGARFSLNMIIVAQPSPF